MLFENKSLIFRREDKSLKKGSPSQTCNPVSFKKHKCLNHFAVFFVFERKLWNLTFYKYSFTGRWKLYKLFIEKNAIKLEL